MPARERGPLDWATYSFSFGQRLVFLRKARGMSQEELAEKSGLHRNAISNLERGTSNREPFISDPQLSTVYRLALALDIAPELLLPDLGRRLTPRSVEQETNESLSLVEAELKRRLIVQETADRKAARAKSSAARKRSGAVAHVEAAHDSPVDVAELGATESD